MSQEFKISVVIPLYNKARTVLSTVQSVLNQEYENFECLIVDDGSTDNSLSILLAITDERVTILTKKNGGVSDARNYGVSHASTDNIFFLDADDIIDPRCLLVLSELMATYPNAAIYTANFYIERDGQFLTFCRRVEEGYISNPLKDLYYRQIFPRAGCTLVRKFCLKESGGFRTEMSVHEDSELFIRLISSYRVAYSPIRVFSYKADFSEMSVNNGNLRKEYAYHIDLRGKSFYEKILLSEIVFKTYQRHLRQNNQKARVLLAKNLIFIPSILFAVLYLKFSRKRHRFVV